MLVKCVCPNCGHSYLSDDQAGDLACPRCDVGAEVNRGASDIPDAYAQADRGAIALDDDDYGMPATFAPQAPPPMIVTRERMVRGLAFGGLSAAAFGAAVGGALRATSFVIPAAAALVMGLLAGLACRYGFGGPCATRSRGRARFVVFICVVLGYAGSLSGAWLVARLTSDRSEVTRQDLDDGLRLLVNQRSRTKDAGQAVLLDQRIAEVEKLKHRSDAQLEDYLLTQEAQINQPLLAYAKLRVTQGPLVRLGADAEPILVRWEYTAGAAFVELLLAFVLAMRVVRSR